MPDKQFAADVIIYGGTSSAMIVGLARDFYHQLYRHYQDSAAWRWPGTTTINPY